MKKKLLLLVLPMAASLIGCNGGEKGPNLAEKALDSLPMLIDFSSGKEVFAGSTSIEAEDYDSYLGLNTLFWKEKEFDMEWVPTPADKWSVKNYATDPSRTKFMPLFGEEEFDCSLTLNISVKGEKISASRTWNFRTDIHVEPDLSEYTYYSIETLEKEYVADNNSHSGDKIYTYGTIVASMEPSEDHIYSGVYIQDGAYGLMLYAGKISKLWFSLGYEIGDQIMIAGTTSPYSGLLEVKPDYMEPAATYLAKEGAPKLAEPVVTDITDVQWDLNNVGVYQSALVKMSGLVYSSEKTKPNVGVHGELVFKKGKTNVPCYINYHIGANAYNTLIEEMAGWTLGETTVDFYGVLSIFNDPQIFPVFGADSFTPAE